MENNKIFNQIISNKNQGKKMIAILLDPEKCFERSFASTIAALKECPPDFIFIGGSLITESFDSIIHILKEELNIPIVLFPGDTSQITSEADAILYLSLISGRNPEYLIGQHVRSAKTIIQSGLEVISTSYILIDGGKTTSVQYFSNTTPIPSDKSDIVLSTVLAGKLIGHKLCYLEAGSGAINPVSTNIVSTLREVYEYPIIVGGGIMKTETMYKLYDNGADLLVFGNSIEENPKKINEFVTAARNYRTNHST